MTPEERELLEKSVALSEENNKILHSMRRTMHISTIMTFVYWVVIIGSAVGAFYLFQPYLDQFKGLYDSASQAVKNFKK